MQEQQTFIQSQIGDVNWCADQGLLTNADKDAFYLDLEKALEVGLKRGIAGVATNAMINEEKLKDYAGNFNKFAPIKNDAYKSIVLISKDYPPNQGGGIATFNKDLAEALALKGHMVHIVTESPDINRVDFENGVWVHRLVVQEKARTHWAIENQIPQHVWNWSATALDEVRRIETHRTVDVIEAPIWDCEGVAFLGTKSWPLVTSLHTTLRFWLDSHAEQLQDADWMASFGSPMLSLERVLMTQSNAIRANSLAIVSEIEKRYEFKFNSATTILVPHGLRSTEYMQTVNRHMGVEVLFVGRLEPRKGIDVLLSALPNILNESRDIRFRIMGTIPYRWQAALLLKSNFVSNTKAKIGLIAFDLRAK